MPSSAAIMHYHARHGKSSIIDPNAVYLCDAGAQYYDGTTDTTRTMHFGTPTEREKEAYTRVLKGLIALDRAIFPKGATGFALDAFARQFLWVGHSMRRTLARWLTFSRTPALTSATALATASVRS